MNINKDTKWEFNSLFNEWTMVVPIPGGKVRGCVTLRDPHAASPLKPPKVWGTIELVLLDAYEIVVNKHDDPVSAIGEVNEYIVGLLATMVDNLANNGTFP